MRIHVNPTTGVPAECRANIECKFGDSPHYSSFSEARAQYENKMKRMEFSPVSKDDGGIFDLDSSGRILEESSTKQPNSDLAEANHRLQELSKQHKATKTQINKIKSQFPNSYMEQNEWYELNKQRKQIYYAMLDQRIKRRQFLSPQEVQQEIDNEIASVAKAEAEFDKWKQNNTFEGFHPEITGKHAIPAVQTMSAFSGVESNEIVARIKEKITSGSSSTEAARAVWGELSIRNDKNLVALDLETAAPMVYGRVDSGMYSTIIEIGYVVRSPDGNTRHETIMGGIPKTLENAVGTGAEEIHNISPKMLTGETEFQEDKEKIEKLAQDLNGAVLVAHNAKFEVKQLSHNMPGFASAISSGRVQVLDTMLVSKYFVPQAENNSNEKFVEASGGKYENAHRALTDAQMSLDALLAVTKTPSSLTQ